LQCRNNQKSSRMTLHKITHAFQQLTVRLLIVIQSCYRHRPIESPGGQRVCLGESQNISNTNFYFAHLTPQLLGRDEDVPLAACVDPNNCYPSLDETVEIVRLALFSFFSLALVNFSCSFAVPTAPKATRRCCS
jgi:hypothetical protein